MKGLLRDTVLYANTQGMLRKGERMRGAAMEEEGWDKTKKVQSNDGHDPFRFFKPISLQVFAFCGELAIHPTCLQGTILPAVVFSLLSSPPLDTIKMFIK